MVIGPTPPGTGVIAPAIPLRLGKGDVADELRFPLGACDAVDADIDDDGALLDPGSAHEFGPADSGDQNIGAPQDRRDVPALGMHERHGAAFGQQQRRHRLADDIGAAKHHGLGDR